MSHTKNSIERGALRRIRQAHRRQAHFESPFEHLTVPSQFEGLRIFDRIYDVEQKPITHETRSAQKRQNPMSRELGNGALHMFYVGPSCSILLDLKEGYGPKT